MMNEQNRIPEEEMQQVSGGATAAMGEPKFVVGDYVFFTDLQLRPCSGHIDEIIWGTDRYYVKDRLGVRHIVQESMLQLLTVKDGNSISGGW